jgi:5-methylcytosine-specific restriction endonuclease McrA
MIKRKPACSDAVWRLIEPSQDHVIPRSQGGKTTLDNLMPAHSLCNSQRGEKPLVYARMQRMFLEAYSLAKEWEEKSLPVKLLYPEHVIL